MNETEVAHSIPQPARVAPSLLLTALLPASLWGINNVAVAVAADQIPVATFNAVRSGLSAALILTWFGLRERASIKENSGRLILSWLLLGGLGLGMFQILFVLSIRMNGPAIMAVLATLSQLMALFYERSVQGRPLGRREIAGSLVALAGVCTIYLPELSAQGDWNVWGLVYGLAAPVCWAAYSIGSRALVPRTGPFIGTGLALSGATLALVPVALFEWSAGLLPRVPEIAAPTWTALGVSVVVGALVSNMVWLRVLQTVGPARALLATYMLPVMTAVISFLVLGEILGPYEAAGSALVILGVAWVRPPKVGG